MTQRAAGIGTIVGSAMKFRQVRIRIWEFLETRSVANGRSCKAKVFSAITQHRRKETIGTSALGTSSLRGECNLRAVLLASRRNKAIFPRLRHRDHAASTGIKRNVISVSFCGLTRARDRREK